MQPEESLNITLAKLEDFCKTNTVIGQPMEIGGITLIPFIEVVFGLGTGSGPWTDGGRAGGAFGLGARIAPSGVLAVRGEEITLYSLRDKCSLDKIIEIIPQIKEILPLKKNASQPPGHPAHQ